MNVFTHHPVRSFIHKHICTPLEGLHRFKRAGAQVYIRFHGITLPALCLICLVWYILSPNEVSISVLATLLGLLLAAYLWARSMATSISARRHLRYTAFQIGDEMEEIITLENRSWLPVLWAEFIDQSDLPEHAVTGVRSANPNSVNQWRFHTHCTRRGVFQLGPWQLVIGDPFGVFRVTYIDPHKEEILVYPPLARIPPQLLPHRAAFGARDPLRQALAAETIKASATRYYQPGDSLRHIHWKTSAHRNQLFVKTFDPEASSTIWMLPDLDESRHLGQGDDSTLENMVLLLTTLAHLLLYENQAVGLYAHGADKIILPPLRERASFWRLLRAIATLQTAVAQPLAQTLSEVKPLIGKHDTLVILTTSIQHWERQICSQLPAKSIHVILFDPVSFGGEGNAQALRALLAKQGVHTSVIQHGDIQPIQASYGALQRWEFKTLSTGRVLVLSSPRLADAIMKPQEDDRG